VSPVAGTVALFGGLKLRLLAGNLRGDLARKLGFAFTLVMAAGLALLGFFLMSLVRLAPADVAADIVVVVFTVFLVSWMIVPLLAFGLDDTLDPSRLSLFPLSTGTLAVGMFTASATGVWPLVTLIVTAGALAGLASGVGGVLLGIFAVLLQFALCLVASRLVTTSLSGALRTRRGRDVLAVAAIGAVLVFQLPNLLVNSGVDDPLALLHGAASVLRWTPSGLAAHAIADGGLVGLAELAVLALVVVAVAWLWIKALSRALVTPDVSTQGGTVGKGSGLVDRFLPDGPLAAVVTKELKYIRREPRYRVVWFSSVVVTAVLAFSFGNQSAGPSGPGTPIALTAMAGLMIALQLGNAFGIDGRSLWMNAVAIGSERGLSIDLAGRHLANALVAAPLLLAIAVAAGLFTGSPEAIVWALCAALGTLGVGFGVGSVTSVVIPFTVPERLNAFTGAAPGQGGQAVASSMGALLGIVLLSAPFVVPAVFGALWVCAFAPLYGLLAETLGRRLGAKIGFARLPEVLAAVSKPT
jgi:ABC-2 type transport system permease protein